MPAIGPTIATFGTTLVSRGFDFTFGPGIQPSVCMIQTTPHVQSLPQVATLTLATQGDTTLTFPNCLLEDPKLSANQSGQIWQLPIKDRRWKWQYGAIYGHYNKPEKNGTYTRERTPSGLIGMLLTEMGEMNWDVSRLPSDANSTRPEKRWDGANPAIELDTLCNELGCIVVLNPFTDLVEIWPVGEGSQLPTSSTTGKAYAPVLPAKPSRLCIDSGEYRFQATWKTEAVGLDIDGKWKPLDQLSYARPGRAFGGFPGDAAANGFEGWYENQTYNSNGKVLNVRDLAASTVFQCYRLTKVEGFVENGLMPSVMLGAALGSDFGFFRPRSLKDLRFFDVLVDEQLNTSGELESVPARALVKWARLDKRTPDYPIPYPHAVSFDSDTHIISFGEPVFLWATNTNEYSIPATVLFECSFNVGGNGVFFRKRFDLPLEGATHPTKTLVIQRPEVRPYAIYRFATDGSPLPYNYSSPDFFDGGQDLAHYFNAEKDRYGLQQGSTVTYPKLMQISPDGLTQQVTWSGGGGRQTQTVASQAQRHNRFIKTVDEYRDRIKAKQLEQKIRAQNSILGDVSTRIVV